MFQGPDLWKGRLQPLTPRGWAAVPGGTRLQAAVLVAKGQSSQASDQRETEAFSQPQPQN